MSRPSSYTEEKGARFASLYASGLTMEAAFKAFPEGPQSYETVVRWEEKHLSFAEAMRVARAAHAEALADGMDDMVVKSRDPILARVRLDAMKWRASKLSKRFADKVELQVEQTVSIAAALDLAGDRMRLAKNLGDAVVVDNDGKSTASLPEPTDKRSLDPADSSEAPGDSEADWPDFMR